MSARLQIRSAHALFSLDGRSKFLLSLVLTFAAVYRQSLLALTSQRNQWQNLRNSGTEAWGGELTLQRLLSSPDSL